MSRKRGPVETPEYIKAAQRFIRAAGRRVGDADDVDLAQLIELRDAVETAIAEAVTSQRANYGRSWQWVANGLGITRQAAQQKYGSAAASAALPTPTAGGSAAHDPQPEPLGDVNETRQPDDYNVPGYVRPFHAHPDVPHGHAHPDRGPHYHVWSSKARVSS